MSDRLEQDVQPGTVVRAGSPLPRPRIRFGAAVWGLILSSAAGAIVLVGTDDARREAFVAWFFALTPPAIVLIALLALGAIMLLVAVLAVVRRAQSRRSEGISGSSPPPD